MNITLPDGYFSDHDISVYRELVQKLPENGIFIEIGTFRGRSLCSLADIIREKKLKVFAIDTFGGTPGEDSKLNEYYSQSDIESEFKSNLDRFELTPFVEILKGSNKNFSNKFNDFSVDMIFIDADHSYEAVCEDLNNWKKKVKFGGILSGHDYLHTPVKNAIHDTIFDKFGYQHNGNMWYKIML